ncbi:class I SAM-dependent methyltransferase [Ilumatobacter nonamiensis]|uniref:class I SAM-dependent methyltransferase n=1 Tax=Ilumatobacter nonamiensis TaxID=467093 RepID=UPI0003467051|nr:class I SAM-dependent methyltransferase [Ilumatobacter nonamiensis]
MTRAVHDDPIAGFYERHPYPPPVDDLSAVRVLDVEGRRTAHHLVWPRRPVPDEPTLLVAGCGTSQAARHAARNPRARVVGIDVSTTSIDHTRRLIEQHDLSNLEVHQLPIENVAELHESFDHIVCTGVLHHLADPPSALAALRGALAPGGALTLMVYAQYGRAGIYVMQEYCRRLGVAPTSTELADLVATLRELPVGHPLDHVLRNSRDIHDDDALADALLNPRDRAYTVPELLALLDAAGLRFGRWERQAPYRPDCGSISETPHASRIAELPVDEQYAAVELFRGTIARHTVIAFADDDPPTDTLDFSGADADAWVPIVVPTAIAVEERLPPGAAAALLNRAHAFTDLVMFADRAELDLFRSIDGTRPIRDLGPGALRFVERLWNHDLVVIDASVGSTS